MLGFNQGSNPTAANVEAEYRQLAKRAHPDSGGTHELMAELNRALAAAGLNILGQHLKTDERTGYVITDVDRDYDPEALQSLRTVAGTLRFRMLH